MKKLNRPLSPHIQIYKPQIGSFTSILHRATGIFLFLGTIAICWAIVYYTYRVDIVLEGQVEDRSCGCVYTKYALYLIVLGWVFSLYYHLCNGIRHLLWDMGKGFDKRTSNKTGILVLVLSVFLTAFSVYYVLFIN